MLFLLGVPLVGCGNGDGNGNGNGSTPPEADFSCDPDEGDAPLTVEFTDKSTGEITSWAWDFDDDREVDSTGQNPTYEYDTAGTYTVSLEVTGPDGSDSKTRIVEVSAVSADAMATIKDLPQGPGLFIFTDVTALRADDDFVVACSNYDAQLEIDCGALGISLDDVYSRTKSESLSILDGHFNLDDVRDYLEDFSYQNAEYKGVETWVSETANEDMVAVALLGGSCIILADSSGSLEDCIDAIKGDTDSLGDDEYVSDAMDRLPAGIRVVVSTDEHFEGCRAYATSVAKKDSNTALYTSFVLFDDEDSASGAMEAIEDEFQGDLDYYDNVEVTQDGSCVVVTAESSIEHISSY
jgi:PKD repeat protein